MQQLVKNTTYWPHVWVLGLKSSSQLFRRTVNWSSARWSWAESIFVNLIWEPKIEEFDVICTIIGNKVVIHKEIWLFCLGVCQAIEMESDVWRLEVPVNDILQTQIMLRQENVSDYRFSLVLRQYPSSVYCLLQVTVAVFKQKVVLVAIRIRGVAEELRNVARLYLPEQI